MNDHRLRTLCPLAGVIAALSLTACDGADELDDAAADAGTSDDASVDEESGGQPEPDSDEDGLSDAEEAELGTDPHDKDTDDDNYWDSWEILEGTDPLDQDSRIYRGWWPYNPAKDELAQGSWATASTAPGSPFPRASFHDRHGDLVDLYDFANFTINPSGAPAPFIIDISAQWCGPCHLMASFLGGVLNPDTAPLHEAYPTVPDKVHELRVWWMTFIVEGSDGGPPNVEDTEIWFSVHPDNFIPVFADEDQLVMQHFAGGWYPFMFLLDPQLAIIHYNDAEPDYYPLDYAEHQL